MERLIHRIQEGDFRLGEFTPPLHLRQFRSEPLSLLEPGVRLELRAPDSSRLQFELRGLSLLGLNREGYSEADDATFYCFPSDPIVRLRFKPRISESMAPPGSELWLVDARTTRIVSQIRNVAAAPSEPER